MARLESYIIADDVELEDETAAWQGWQIAGPGVGAWLSQWRAEGAVDERVGWREANQLPPESIRVVSKSQPEWPVEWQEGNDAMFTRARVLAGIPEVGIDLGDGDFPQEAQQEGVGVSFRKGCYLGQEVMARLTNTGRVRRRLTVVAGEGVPPTTLDEGLFQQEKQVGTLRSRVVDEEAGWVGLAMMNLAHFDEAQPMTTAAGAKIRPTTAAD